jgi:hypothetical protein
MFQARCQANLAAPEDGCSPENTGEIGNIRMHYEGEFEWRRRDFMFKNESAHFRAFFLMSETFKSAIPKPYRILDCNFVL